MSLGKDILLLIADDLDRERVGCYGGESCVTPIVNGLAASGSRFDMGCTSTASSCSGRRTVIYTGLHIHETGSNGSRTFDNVETAPLLFEKIGYKTGLLVKVHVSPDSLYPWQTRLEKESRNVA